MSMQMRKRGDSLFYFFFVESIFFSFYADAQAPRLTVLFLSVLPVRGEGRGVGVKYKKNENLPTERWVSPIVTVAKTSAADVTTFSVTPTIFTTLEASELFFFVFFIGLYSYVYLF